MLGSICHSGISQSLMRAWRIRATMTRRKPMPTQLADLERHLTERAEGIRRCWVPDRPFYIDAHDLPLELKVTGIWPVEHLFEGLRRRGLRPIPVSGTGAERGVEYVSAMGR